MSGLGRKRCARAWAVLAGSLLMLTGTPRSDAQQTAPKESPEETCKACHEPYFNTYLTSKHGTKADARTPANKGGCFTCHGAGALEHAQKGGGRGVGGVVNPASKTLSATAKNDICLACQDQAAPTN